MPRTMTIKLELEPSEIRYLLELSRDDLEYHRVLAGNGKCTEKTRQRYRFLEKMNAKLLEQTAQ